MGMTLEKVSVIIPVYNVESYLAICLKSVTDQDYKNLEIIAVNDGSTDASLNILREFSRTHANILTISIENQGQSVARNAGLAAATGEYAVFLDGDDWLEADAISICVNQIRHYQTDIVCFSAEPFADGVDPSLTKKYNYERRSELLYKKMSSRTFFARCLALNNYVPSACLYMYRRSKLQGVLFYPGIVHEDNLFTTRLLLQSEDVTVVCIQDKLLNRRLRPNSIMTQRKQERHVQGYITVAQELSKLPWINEGSDAGKALASYIQDLLLAAMRTCRIVHDGRFPLPIRKRVLRLLFGIKAWQISPKCIAICAIPEMLLIREYVDKLLGV